MAEQIGSLSTAQNWQWMGKSFIKIVEETMAVLQRNFRGLGELKFRRSDIATRTLIRLRREELTTSREEVKRLTSWKDWGKKEKE